MKKLDELSVEYAGLKKVLTDKYGTTDDDKVTIKKENVQAFSEEYGELLKIEHDLEMELLPLPKSMEDNVSSSELDIIDKFFDLSSLN